LAIEVKPFGIQCCTILPGDTKTDFTSARKYAKKSQSTDSVYYQTMKKSVGRMEKDEQNGMEARIVAKQMADQAMRKSMKVTVVPGFQYKVICWLFKILPTRISLWIVGLLYG